MNVPLSWASLAGMHLALASEPSVLYSTPAPEPPSLPPVSTPEPRRSKRTLSIPGHYAVSPGTAYGSLAEMETCR
jgi:hypothetical protein